MSQQTEMYFGIIIGVLALIAVIYFIVRQFRSAWEGTLVDKQEKTSVNDDNSTTNTYILIFETSEGKKVKIQVPSNKYDAWQIGDKAQKKSGKFYPEKII